MGNDEEVLEFEIIINGVPSPARSRRLTEAVERVRCFAAAGLTATLRPITAECEHDDAFEGDEPSGRRRRLTEPPSFVDPNTALAERESIGPIHLQNSKPPQVSLVRGDSTGVFRTRCRTSEWLIKKAS